MAWIESHQSLKDHPKTRKLARLLGISTPAAIGHLHCFWWWALDYADDGNLSRYDEMDLAIGGEWEGDSAQFVNAMVAAGFIDETDDDGLVIHDWFDYAGKLIERRRANAQRMKEARAEHVQDTSSARAEHVQGTQRARAKLPNQPTKPTKPTVPNQPTNDERFDIWYAAYPKKVGKQKARQAFQKIDWRKVDFDHMMDALEQHKQSEQWQKDGGQFIPHPTTYLNRGGWDDDLKPAQPRGSTVTEPRGYSSDPDEAERQMQRDLQELEQQSRSGYGQITPLRREA